MNSKKNRYYTLNKDNRAFRFVEDVNLESIGEFVDSLNLPFEGEMQGEEYVVDMHSSDEFSEMYNLISTNKNLHLNDDSMATDGEARFSFYSDNYNVGLLADFDEDDYKLEL